jgi:hypothetical protein
VATPVRFRCAARGQCCDQAWMKVRTPRSNDELDSQSA